MNKTTQPLPLGELLRSWRQKRGLSQNALARCAGVAPSTLCRWEAGKTYPGIPELDAVLSALDAGEAEAREALRHICAPRGLQKMREMGVQTVSGQADQSFALPGASLLWAMRRRANVTQAQAARAAGVTQAQIARWENGQAWPDHQKLHRLCWFLRVRPEEAAALTTGAAGAVNMGANLSVLPAEADEQAWRVFLKHLLYKPPPAALTDLVFIALESRLQDMAPHHGFALPLLPTVYALHARRHLYNERPDLAAHWAKCGLLLARTHRANVDNQPLWFGSVIASAVFAGQNKKPAGLRRGVRLLQNWLPLVQECSAHCAWGTSVLALQMARLGHAEAGETMRTACQTAERAKAIEKPLRLLDRAALLRDLKRPAEALQSLEACREDLENNSTYNYVRHRLRETACFLDLTDLPAADERVRMAEKAVRAAPLRTPLEKPLLAVAQKMGSRVLTEAGQGSRN